MRYSLLFSISISIILLLPEYTRTYTTPGCKFLGRTCIYNNSCDALHKVKLTESTNSYSRSVCSKGDGSPNLSWHPVHRETELGNCHEIKKVYEGGCVTGYHSIKAGRENYITHCLFITEGSFSLLEEERVMGNGKLDLSISSSIINIQYNLILIKNMGSHSSYGNTPATNVQEGISLIGLMLVIKGVPWRFNTSTVGYPGSDCPILYSGTIISNPFAIHLHSGTCSYCFQSYLDYCVDQIMVYIANGGYLTNLIQIINSRTTLPDIAIYAAISNDHTSAKYLQFDPTTNVRLSPHTDCQSGCESCINDTACIKCQTGKYQCRTTGSFNDCYDSCSSCIITGKHTFSVPSSGVNICSTCHSDCATCEGGNEESDCTSCTNIIGPPTGHQRVACPANLGNIFGSCYNNCLDCFNSGLADSYINKTDNNGNIKTILGQYQNHCVVCDHSCAACVGEIISECTLCKEGVLCRNTDTINKGTCLSNCDTCLIDLKSSYEQDGICIKCHIDCETCGGTTNEDCRSCQTGDRLCKQSSGVGTCIHICKSQCVIGETNPLHTYDNGSPVCQECHEYCDECSGGSTTDCVTCKPERPFLCTLPPLSGECVADCDSCIINTKHTYNNVDLCTPCDMLCDRCKGPGAVTNCTSCSNNTGSAYQDQDNQGILLEFCSPIEGDARGSCRERNNCSLCRIESLHSYMMDSTFICEKCDATCKECDDEWGYSCINCNWESRLFCNDTGSGVITINIEDLADYGREYPLVSGGTGGIGGTGDTGNDGRDNGTTPGSGSLPGGGGAQDTGFNDQDVGGSGGTTTVPLPPSTDGNFNDQDEEIEGEEEGGLITIPLHTNHRTCVLDCINHCTIGGKFTFPLGSQCITCEESCRKCVGEHCYECLTCPTGKYLCPITEHEPLSGSCGDNCTECRIHNFLTYEGSGSRCKACDIENCGIMCQFNYYFDSNLNTCEMCQPACLQCFQGTSADCYVCQDTYILRNFTHCVENTQNCLPNEFYNSEENSCYPCSFNCLQCPHYPNCTKCTTGYILYPELQVCLTECNNGLYFDQLSGVCVKCSDNCINCINQTYCISCTQGAYLFDNSCILGCTSNSYINKNNCELCHPRCTRCDGPSDKNCTECNTDKFHSLTLSKECLVRCAQNYFYDQNTNQCLKCFDRCVTCTGPNTKDCITCKAQYILDNSTNECKLCSEINPGMELYSTGLCQEICGDGINLGLVQCDDGNVNNGDGCNQYCLVEYGYTCSLDTAKKDICKEIVPPLLFLINVTINNTVIFGFSEHVYANINEFKKWQELLIITIGGRKNRSLSYEYEVNFNLDPLSNSFKAGSVNIIMKNSLEGNEKISLDFTNYRIKDMANNLLLDPQLIANLHQYTYLPEKEKDLAVDTGTAIMNGGIGFFSLTLLLQVFFSMSMNVMWALINMLQLINMMPLLMIDLPENLRIFITEYLGWANLHIPWLHNFFHQWGVIDLSTLEDNPINHKFGENGYKSRSILVNYGGQMVLWGCLLAFYPFICLLARCTKLKFFIRLKKAYKYTTIITALNESFMEISLVMLISIWDIGYDSKPRLWSTSTATAFLLFIGCYLVGSLNLVSIKAGRLTRRMNINYYGALYENYKILRTSRLRLTHFYNYFFLLRRVLFAVVLVFLFKNPLLQQIFNVIIHLGICFINLFQRPFTGKLFGYMVTVFDILTLLCFLTVAFFLVDKETITEYDRIFLGRIMIIVIAVSIILCWGIILVKIIVHCIKALKNSSKHKKKVVKNTNIKSRKKIIRDAKSLFIKRHSTKSKLTKRIRLTKPNLQDRI